MTNKKVYEEFYSDPEIFTLVLLGEYEEAKDKVIKKRWDSLKKGEIEVDDRSKLYFLLYTMEKDPKLQSALESVIETAEKFDFNALQSNEVINDYLKRFLSETKEDVFDSIVYSYFYVADILFENYKKEKHKVAYERLFDFVKSVRDEIFTTKNQVPEIHKDYFEKYFIISAGGLLSMLDSNLFNGENVNKYAPKLLEKYTEKLKSVNDVSYKLISGIVRETFFEILKEHVEGVLRDDK